MVADAIACLLVLQERDLRAETLRQQLQTLPLERSRTESKITSELARKAESEASLKSLEVRRKETEGRIAAAEDQILKYKTQQLQVKKNEEYTALEHEIARQRSLISEAEDATLSMLEEIDKASQALAQLRAAVAEEVRLQREHLALLDRQKVQVESEITAALESLESARQSADAEALKVYTMVRTGVKRGPWVVPLEHGKCSGCHLKVSSDTEAAVRKPHGLVRCGQCGRIIYLDR